jgi:flagellar basal-body rod protein FlgG
MGLIDIGGVMLSRAEQRVEVAAQNLTNATVPGYRARSIFPSLLDTVNPTSDEPGMTSVDFTNGPLRNTGNPLDLAISGSGFFVVRSNAATYYTRDGQFQRDTDGRIVTAEGYALQCQSGDAVVKNGDPKIIPDGTVLDGDEPVGRLLIVNFANPQSLRPAGAGVFSADDRQAAPASPEIREGMLEGSNVSTAGEMISIMAGLRSAQSGQQLIQFYDDLMGRALVAFGQQ